MQSPRLGRRQGAAARHVPRRRLNVQHGGRFAYPDRESIHERRACAGAVDGPQDSGSATAPMTTDGVWKCICRRIACTAVAVLACGCAGRYIVADDLASAAAFTKSTVRGTQFTHVAYSADGGGARAPVWVYIEGDGVPWIDETMPARDPTPRALVALGLMAKGPRPAVHLGRPCYFGTAGDPPCGPVWWTHRRFAPEVVASMIAALRRLIDSKGWRGRAINLVGFSGGGTLAALMASRLEGVCALVSIASPLDTDEWTVSRGFSPLAGSENPARQPPIHKNVRQLHLRGQKDRIVPPDNGLEFRRRNPAAEFRVIAGADHGPGWVAIWANIHSNETDAALRSCN